MRIRTKIGLALGAPLAAAILGVSISWFLSERRQLRNSLESQRNAQLSMWTAACKEARISRSDLALLSYLRVLKQAEGFSYAYLVNPEDEIVVHSDPRFILRPHKDWLAQASSATAILREQALPLEDGTSRAVLGFSRAHAEEELVRATREILRDTLKVGAIALAAMLLLAWKLSDYLTRQIVSLSKGAERVGTGNFASEVPVLSADELGELARGFNQMARKLSDLSELKDSLITNVSHDLRSPLVSVMMYAEYLLTEDNGTLTPRQKRMLTVLHYSANRLAIFINNILDLARIKDGKMTYRFEPCDLEAAAKASCQLFQPTAELRKISLTAGLPAGLPAVRADRDQLGQVLSNLLSNAMKFTPDGGRIHVGASPKGKEIEVSVSDTGPGIPAKDLGRIFDKYEQSEEEGKKSMKIRGTGLGLSLVKEAVERHGGRVWVESEVGRGTTFRFTLPASDKAAIAAPPRIVHG